MTESTINYHQDLRLLHDAIRFTAAETGFSERLIEKDYYCTLALADLAVTRTGVIFKGGTCLSKIYTGFYRLSEDLDFGVSADMEAARSERRKRIDAFKSHLAQVYERLDVLRIVDPLRGFNNSTQYGSRLAYRSVISGQDEFIKVEVSVREPVVEPSVSMPARTLLLDPFRRSQAISAVNIPVLTKREVYCEKLRAALSRRDPAIRDFFDLHQAFSVGDIDPADHDLLALLKRKLSIPGNEPIDMSPGKLQQLRDQLETQLRPVLRNQDFTEFDLDSAFNRVSDIAGRLED